MSLDKVTQGTSLIKDMHPNPECYQSFVILSEKLFYMYGHKFLIDWSMKCDRFRASSIMGKGNYHYPVKMTRRQSKNEPILQYIWMFKNKWVCKNLNKIKTNKLHKVQRLYMNKIFVYRCILFYLLLFIHG